MDRDVKIPMLLALVVCAGIGASCSGSSPTSSTPAQNSNFSFTLISESPQFGATVLGKGATDLQGTVGLSLTFQITASSKPVYFELHLLRAGTECLRTQIANSTPTSSTGSTYGYSSTFFVRDNQQLSCGTTFTTDHVQFLLFNADPAAGVSTPGQVVTTLFTQNITGGWTFKFGP